MTNALLGTLKFLFAILLLPVVGATTYVFSKQVEGFPPMYQEFFYWGILVFLLSFFFLYQYWGFFEFGQKIVANIFKFMAPFDVLAAYLFPFFLLIIFLAFYITVAFFKNNQLDHYFMFFIGFFLSMHLLLAAQEMQDQEKTPIKPHYMLIIAVVFIVNVCIVVLFLNLILGAFTFPQFIEEITQEVQKIYSNIFDKIRNFQFSFK